MVGILESPVKFDKVRSQIIVSVPDRARTNAGRRRIERIEDLADARKGFLP